MLIFVIIFNFLLSCLNLYLAFRLLRLRQVLVRVTATLTRVERRTHRILSPAPAIVFQGQQGTHHLGQAYQKLRKQLESLQPIILLFSLGVRVWRRQSQPQQWRQKNQVYSQTE